MKNMDSTVVFHKFMCVQFYEHAENFRISHCHCHCLRSAMYYYKLVCLFENASLLFYSNSSSAITSCKLENCIVMSAPSGHMIPNLLFFFSSPLSLARCVWVCERACLYLRECASVVGGQRKQVISENWQIFSNAYQQNWWTRLHALTHTNVENENVNESDY